MMQADIGVYPAISDCHMDVALSLKIPEMVNMRLPIVATRLPVLEELYGENAIAFVPSDDHEALASKILELGRSPELRPMSYRQCVAHGHHNGLGASVSCVRSTVGVTPYPFPLSP